MLPLSASSWSWVSRAMSTFGFDCTPHWLSLLKYVIPALVASGSRPMAFFSDSRTTSHFDGALWSFLVAIASQSAELVRGGRLQFMLPLRSMMKRRLAGTRDAVLPDVAQPERVELTG